MKKANLAKQEAVKSGVTIRAAYLDYKKGLYPITVAKCTKLIKMNSKDARAYVLRAQAELKLLDYVQAYKDLEQAHKLDPKNKRIAKMYDTVGKNKLLNDPKGLERAKKVGYAKYLSEQKKYANAPKNAVVNKGASTQKTDAANSVQKAKTAPAKK